jgi:hypothetical protein
MLLALAATRTTSQFAEYLYQHGCRARGVAVVLTLYALLSLHDNAGSASPLVDSAL